MPSRKLTHVRASVKTNNVNTNVYSVECLSWPNFTAIDSYSIGNKRLGRPTVDRDVTHIVDNLDNLLTAH
jgi:hypothetical protein